jgi:hypothetical protein
MEEFGVRMANTPDQWSASWKYVGWFPMALTGVLMTRLGPYRYRASQPGLERHRGSRSSNGCVLRQGAKP